MFGRKNKCCTNQLVESVEDRIRSEVEARHAKKLAIEKMHVEFNKLPEYRITSFYDVHQHKDVYQISRKKLHHLYSGDTIISFTEIYHSTDKPGVNARFNRLMKDAAAAKKTIDIMKSA